MFYIKLRKTTNLMENKKTTNQKSLKDLAFKNFLLCLTTSASTLVIFSNVFIRGIHFLELTMIDLTINGVMLIMMFKFADKYKNCL